MIADELKVVIRAETAKAVREMRRAQQGTDQLEKQFKTTIATAARMTLGFATIGGAAVAMGRSVRQSFDAFARLEAAQNRMATAAEMAGENVDRVVPQYNALAAEMQQLTVVSGGAATELIALAQSMGVTSRDMGQVVRGSIGLSRALGMDTTSALRAVTNAMEGNFTQLQRYLPQLRTATTDAERMAIVQKAMSDSFEVATRETQTVSGTIEQYRNAIGSLREAQGALLAQSARPLLEWARDLAVQLAASAAATVQLQEAQRRAQEGTASGADLALVSNEKLARLERERERVLRGFPGQIRAQRDADLERIDRQIAAEQRLLAARLERERFERQLAQQTSERERRETEAALADAKRREEEAQALSDWLAKVNSAYARTTEARWAEIDAQIAWFENAQKQADRTAHMFPPIIAMLKEQREQLAGITQEEIEYLGDWNTQLAQAMLQQKAWDEELTEAAKRESEKRAAARQAEVQAWMSAAGMVASQSMALWGEMNRNRDQRAQNEIGNIRRELDAMRDRHDREVAFARAAGATEQELAEMRRDQLIERQEAEEQAREREGQIRRQTFEADKRMRLAQTLMAGAQAVANALASLPPPANFAAASAVGALTAAQVATIQQQQVPAFERGGSFVTRGPQLFMAGDGQSPRERITVEPLSGPYKRSGGGGDTINVYFSGVVDEASAVKLVKVIERAKQRGAA